LINSSIENQLKKDTNTHVYLTIASSWLILLVMIVMDRH